MQSTGIYRGTTEKAVCQKKESKQTKEKISVKERIKPRGLAGLYKGQIHYDKNADIFNLSL
jgi:hypothetical protein